MYQACRTVLSFTLGGSGVFSYACKGSECDSPEKMKENLSDRCIALSVRRIDKKSVMRLAPNAPRRVREAIDVDLVML